LVRLLALKLHPFELITECSRQMSFMQAINEMVQPRGGQPAAKRVTPPQGEDFGQVLAGTDAREARDPASSRPETAPVRAERPERRERPERPAHPHRADQPQRPSRPERPDRPRHPHAARSEATPEPAGQHEPGTDVPSPARAAAAAPDAAGFGTAQTVETVTEPVVVDGAFSAASALPVPVTPPPAMPAGFGEEGAAVPVAAGVATSAMAPVVAAQQEDASQVVSAFAASVASPAATQVAAATTPADPADVQASQAFAVPSQQAAAPPAAVALSTQAEAFKDGGAPQQAGAEGQMKPADAAPLASAVQQAAGAQARATVEPAPAATAGGPSEPVNPLVSANSTQQQAQPSAQTLAAANAQATQPPSRADAPVPMQVFAVEIGMRAMRGAKEFQIRLDPEDLGRIDVKLEISEKGEVQAKLMVERVETLQLLQRDARTLERAFDQAGLKTNPDGLQFSLRDPGQQGGQQGRGFEEQARASGLSRDTADAEPDILPTISAIYRAPANGGLDIRI
jgi:flagellar hook-length control protein FliK